MIIISSSYDDYYMTTFNSLSTLLNYSYLDFLFSFFFDCPFFPQLDFTLIFGASLSVFCYCG
jgi:hypothetical protein